MSATAPSLGNPRPLSLQRRIDDACDRFETAWKAGGTATSRTGSTVGKSRSVRRRRELILLEVYSPRGRGENGTADEYLARSVPGP